MTLSGVSTRPPITTKFCVAFLAPVAKIVTRKLPFVGSKGPSCNVSLLITTAAPVPSPDLVKIPGAARKVVTLPRNGKLSGFVTTTSAVPSSVCGGGGEVTLPGGGKKKRRAPALDRAPLAVTR